MILPYYMRLLCLCLATFFVVHTLAWMLVRSASSTALKIAETMRPRPAARLLFWLRTAPVAVTLFLVAGFCVPSYVWLEPDISGERVGAACLLAAGMGGVVWAVSLLRGLTSVVRTERYMRQCEVGRPACRDQEQKSAQAVLATRHCDLRESCWIIHCGEQVTPPPPACYLLHFPES